MRLLHFLEIENFKRFGEKQRIELDHFEAFVAKHLARKLARPLLLKTQERSHYLVRDREQNRFRLKPGLLIREAGRDARGPSRKRRAVPIFLAPRGGRDGRRPALGIQPRPSIAS